MNDYDSSNWKERFFGWLPRRKASIIFLLANMAFFYECIFRWRLLPSKLVFGWWPIHHFMYSVVYVSIGVIIWGLYYNKFWPEIKNKDE